MQFRDAVESDLSAIVAIYNATIPGRGVTADLDPVSVDSRRDWFRSHTPERRPLWVVESERRIVGWVSFSDFYGRPAYAASAELSLYLDASARGQGVGRMALERAIAVAPALRIETLLGFIFGHNEVSLRLFERHGFARWGTLPRVAKLDGVERDLVIVGRRLGE